MAKTSTKVVDIQTEGAAKSLAELRKQINDSKSALYEMKEGSEEYNKTLHTLSLAQEELSGFMAKTRSGCAALEGSYNALSYQMGVLKQAWKSTNDEAERDALGKQIDELNTKLKEMDASVGVYSRNVGNYTGSMVDAFNKVGINIGNINPLFANLTNSVVLAGSEGKTAIQGLTTTVQGFGNSLKALAANPIGAVIMALVLAFKLLTGAIDKVKESIARNEEATNNMKQAMVPIKAIVQVVTNAFDDFVEVITRAAGALGSLVAKAMQFLGLAGEMVEAENNLAASEEAHDKARRDRLVENAELERDAAELRAKAADKEHYTAQERLAFIQEAAEKQKQIAANNKKNAEEELALLEQQAALGKNSKEDNDKLAEAKARVLRTETEYNNVLRETNKQTSALAKEERDRVKKLREEQKKFFVEFAKFGQTALQGQIADIEKKESDLIDVLKKQLKDGLLSREEYNKHVLEVETRTMTQITKLYEDYGVEIQKMNQEYATLFYSESELAVANEKATWNEKIRTQKEQMAIYVKDGMMTQEQMDKNLAALRLKADQEIAAVERQTALDESKKQIDLQEELDKAVLDKRLTDGEISAKEYVAQITQMEIDANNERITALQDYQTSLQEALENQLITRREFDQAMLESNTEMTQLMVENLNVEKAARDEQMQGIIDTLGSALSTIQGVADQFDTLSAGMSAALDGVISTIGEVGNALKSGEKGWSKWGAVAATALSGASQMLGALASEQDETSKEGFETAKALRYGEAVTGTASGIVSAWAAAMQLGPIAGPIMGAVLSAMMTTMGGIQIANISKQKFGDKSGGSSVTASNAGVNATVAPPVLYSSDIQGASTEQEVKDTRVFVVESDITDTQGRVQTAQNESRY